MRFTLTAGLMLSAAFAISAARAQQVDAYVGLGTEYAGSTGKSIDTFGDGTLHPTPALTGVFTDFGIDVSLRRQLGFGFTSTRGGNGDYAGLTYRPSFYTFDAVFQPAALRTKRSATEFRAGIGFASLHFDVVDQPSCNMVGACPSARYFLEHLSAATRLYMVGHVFLRPSVDLRYVHGFSEFGSNWAPGFSLSVGYSFGKE